MIKQKLLALGTAGLIGLSSASVYGQGMFIPSGVPTILYPGITTKAPVEHLIPWCIINTENLLCLNPTDIPMVVSIWLDWGMTAATAVDYGAGMVQGDRTIDATDAIEQLEEALKGSGSGGSSGGEDTSGDASLAAAYTADSILSQIEVTKGSAGSTFGNTREAVKEYLFETPAPDIKGDCTQSDKDCAVARQSEWLLASVALASATADKVLAQKVTDGSELAGSFNSATSPMDLYNQMANIVLEAHRQTNDANALFGRDLEAQGLRVVTETGPVSLTETKETEE